MFKNRVRLPISFTKPQFPMERNTFRKADGSTQVLSIVIRNTYEGKTDQLPQDWHRKLVIAMAHDSVSIENERLLSNVVLDGDYGIDWEDFLQKPIASANFSIQVTPFSATNNNCQSCEDAQQLNLVDDYTDEIWNEGETHEFPDVLTDNDSICCRPFTISLVTYNIQYFFPVTISADGVLTATVRDPCPNIDQVWIATYRVTCPDGSYDEANVYGVIMGSETSCISTQEITYEVLSNTSIMFAWIIQIPLPSNGWDWAIYLSSDLGTPVQTGNVTNGTVTVTGLLPNTSYTFTVITDCGETQSVPASIVVSTSGFAAQACGRFLVTYLPYGSMPPQSISYMDCNGAILNKEFTYAHSEEICMFITNGSESPVYFVASTPDISITYLSLCDIDYE